MADDVTVVDMKLRTLLLALSVLPFLAGAATAATAPKVGITSLAEVADTVDLPR